MKLISAFTICAGDQLERTRDLYEQALDTAPPEESKPLFLQYAMLEEKHGLARHAMVGCTFFQPRLGCPTSRSLLSIHTSTLIVELLRRPFTRGLRSVCLRCERLAIYDIYIRRASEFFGIGKVREIYETAIESQPPDGLSDEDTRTICTR